MDARGWVLQFDKPGFAEMSRLRGIIQNTPSPPGSSRFLARGSAVVEGSLDEIMSKLADVLEEDYAKNISESANEPWSFDYTIMVDERDKSLIRIYTRLFKPDDRQMGSIFYGRVVACIGRGRYQLLLDDEA